MAQHQGRGAGMLPREREREQKKNKTEQEKKGAEGTSGKEAGERDTARKKQWRGQKEQKSTAKGTER